MSGKAADETLTVEEIDVAFGLLLSKLRVNDTSGREDGDIQRLDKHVDSLQATLDAVQRRIHAQMATSRRRRNTLVAIHRLPTELLMAIFELSLSSLVASVYFEGLARISGVSSAWRAIVLASPALWAVICSDNPKRLIKAAFERSKGCPLKVVCRGAQMVGSTLPKQIAHEGPRIRSLDIDVWGEDASALAVVHGPAPALEILNLHSALARFDTPEGLDLFKGHAPRLRDISLAGISIRWDSPILTRLKSIEMYQLSNGGPSIKRMLYILTQAPELTRLILHGVDFSKESSSDPSTPSLVSLPRLIALRLNDISSGELKQLLDKIRVPACLHLEVECKRVESAIQIPVTSIAHLKPIIAATAVAQKTMDIDILHDRVTFESGAIGFEAGVKGSFLLSLPASNAKPYLQWLVDLLPRSAQPNTPSVEVNFGADYIFNDTAILGLLNRLKVIKLDLGTLLDVNPVIQHLLHPTTTSGDKATQRWNFPNLESLYIDDTFDEAPMLEMLRKRYPEQSKPNQNRKGKGKKGKKPAPKTNLPVPLTSLVFVGPDTIDRDTFEEVEQILGPGVAEWEDEDEDDIDPDEYDYDDDLDEGYDDADSFEYDSYW